MMEFESKKLIDDPNAVVTDFIEGLVETYPGLQYLDGFPEIKVVLRADVSAQTNNRVAVISGGGSGHEPAHAGYVGEGMLTAAICGDVFASPSVDAILAGIRAVTGPPGCLLIVKNYLDDRFKFGLAAEQAKSEGYKVEVVIVADDCALPPPRGIAGRRGLAGTILVHKVAGAAAAAGLSLAEVAAEAKEASETVGTFGVSLSAGTLPGHMRHDRIGTGKMVLGLGVHGEPGVTLTEIQPVDKVVAHVLYELFSKESNYIPMRPGSQVILMVNGLGSTTLMEVMIVAGKAIPRLMVDQGIAVERVYSGSFFTSLDMAGFSITVMEANERVLNRLDAPTRAPNWPVAVEGFHPTTKIPLPLPKPIKKERPDRPQQPSPQGEILELAILAAANEMIKLKDGLDECDGLVGDGDCGTTMAKGAAAIIEDLEKWYPLNDPVETVGEIASSIQRAMGGTSGTIYTIFFTAAYAYLKEKNYPSIKAPQWVETFVVAVNALIKYSGANAGSRTLLDALIPALALLKRKVDAGEDPIEAFVLSSEQAVIGAESTKGMQAQTERSRYISPALQRKHSDPGAMAAASWYRAAALAIKNFLLSRNFYHSKR